MTATIIPLHKPSITPETALWCATVTYINDGRAELFELFFDDHATLPLLMKLQPGQIAEYNVRPNPHLEQDGGAA